MKFCVVQTKPVKGDIQANIADHKKWIEQAAAHNTDVIIFPELSLTGYEPTLAQELATTPDDERLDAFQNLSDIHQHTIGVGIPTRNETGLCISMVLFQPHKPRYAYSKKYLHADEEPFFVSGQNFPTLNINDTQTGLAICYELSIPAHAELAYQNGADVYIASVAKTAAGVNNANQRLADIARTYSMPVLMANCVGPSDNFVSAGGTAVWNDQGALLAQLDDTGTGFLIYDTETQKVVEGKQEQEKRI
jgi:predicted amidohydrolase